MRRSGAQKCWPKSAAVLLRYRCASARCGLWKRFSPWRAQCFFDFNSSVVGAVQTPVAILLQTTPQQTANHFRSFGGEPPPVRLGLEHSRQNLTDRFPFERSMSGEHLIKNTAECPGVRATVGIFSFRLFR